MKKTLLLSFLGILIYSCSSSKIDKNKIRYFDQSNIEVSKSKFSRILIRNKLLIISGDSTNHKKLALREKRGKINNRSLLESLLEKQTNQEIDSDKPIVIVYYPGKDPCSPSASFTTAYLKFWFGLLENGINQIAQTKPIYIYKEKKELENYDGVLNWHKDPEETIEKLFFNNHYPGNSFVVISKDGNYISYFGHFEKEYAWEATQLMIK